MAKGPTQSATSSQTTQSSTQLPDWLTNASAEAVNRSVALSNQTNTPYYQGQQVAGPAQDTQQAYEQVRQLQGIANPAFALSQNAYANQGLLGQLAPQTAQGINDLSNQLYGGYQQNVLNPAQGLLGGYLQGGPATAQQVGANAQALMSPYAQSVIDPTVAAGQQQLALANQRIAAQANNVGAFGGSRQGVQEGVAEAQVAANTQQQVAQLLNQGWGQALTPAYGLASQAGQQAYGAAGLLGQMGQQGYANAQAAGQGIANQNLAAGEVAAQQLPAQAIQQAQLQQQQAGALQASGTAQQQYQQQLIDEQMGNWQAQYQQPYQNLYTLLASVGAVPYGTTSTGSSTGTTTQKSDPGLLNTIGAYVGFASKLGSTAASAAKGGGP
jgi:hypothetical protein